MGLGHQNATKIKKSQFEYSSKLCMCILKALDQEQVDLKNNRGMKTEIFLNNRDMKNKQAS